MEDDNYEGPYNMKMTEHLQSGSYIKIQGNPMNIILNKFLLAINNSSLDEEQKKRLIPEDSIMARIYGLPKVHKVGNPLRPIVNTIGSPTYALAKYLTNKLKPLTGNGFSFIKYSTHLVEMLKDWKMCENDTLVSFDILSLYTNIPIDKAIDVVK